MEKNHSFQRSQLFKKNFEFPMGRIPFHKLRFDTWEKGIIKRERERGKKDCNTEYNKAPKTLRYWKESLSVERG